MAWSVRQHIPNFCSGFDPKDGAVDSVDELLRLPWVAHWAKSPDFVRFSHAPVSEHWRTPEHLHSGRSCAESHLMAEMHDDTFWVVAYLDALGDWSALPVWDQEAASRKYRATHPEARRPSDPELEGQMRAQAEKSIRSLASTIGRSDASS
jgi:hypothetical protein